MIYLGFTGAVTPFTIPPGCPASIEDMARCPHHSDFRPTNRHQRTNPLLVAKGDRPSEDDIGTGFQLSEIKSFAGRDYQVPDSNDTAALFSHGEVIDVCNCARDTARW